MARINPYIRFNGNAEEAFSFYQSVFGGEFAAVMRYSDLSGAGHPAAGADADKLMHISLPVGNGNLLMGSDTVERMGRVSETDNRNAISITAESRGEADRLFSGLSAGGVAEMPMADSPWGAYFGMLTDRYGVEWLVSFNAGG